MGFRRPGPQLRHGPDDGGCSGAGGEAEDRLEAAADHHVPQVLYCTVCMYCTLLYITVLYVCTAVLFCTIIILSWGAEEYSLCGSREFVEQYEMEVSERSVSFQ